MELVILIGLQASGKSTFYRQRFAATHAYVSRDQFRNNRNPARRQRDLIEEALSAGRDVVVDNTNPRVVDRAPIIQQGKAHGARNIGFFFEPNVKQSLALNRGRDSQERVPDVAIFTAAKRLEAPSLSEGFDQLFSVTTTADGDFRVRPTR